MSSKGKTRWIKGFNDRVVHIKVDDLQFKHFNVNTLCGEFVEGIWHGYDSELWTTAERCPECVARMTRQLLEEGL